MLCQIKVDLMKKISLLLFAVSVFPNVSLAATCENARSGEYEFSECMFRDKNYSDAVKKFWGNPKVNSNETLNSDGTAGDFILRRAWQCGQCAGTDNHSCGNHANSSIYENCANSSSNKISDDQMMLAYVATDVSDHGAEFCLTQFAGASWTHPLFFIYHQVPTDYAVEQLHCAWFCEPGWDGDRCETKGAPAGHNTWTGLKTGADKIKTEFRGENLKTKNLFGQSECDGCSSAAFRTVVLDYKKTGKQVQPWGGEGVSYQQEIVIGATSFLENGKGIKARPMLIGANGGHTSCFSASYEKEHWSNSEYTTYPYNVNNRKYLEKPTQIFAKAVNGGKERVLCLQGFTADENCSKSYYGGDGAVQPCAKGQWSDTFGFDNSMFDQAKHYRSYYAKNNCLIFKCLNGMNFSPDDNYACSLCIDKIYQGLCPTTNKCVWCGVGKCFNKPTCKCDACSSVVTKDQMRFGPNKTDECWSIIDADEFRACVTGGRSASSEE